MLGPLHEEALEDVREWQKCGESCQIKNCTVFATLFPASFSNAFEPLAATENTGILIIPFLFNVVKFNCSPI
jgi:hypothetical protein